MLAIKGLYLDISDWFWLFGRSKYNIVIISSRINHFYGIMIIIVRERLINDFKRAFLKFGQKDLPVQMEQLIVVR